MREKPMGDPVTATIDLEVEVAENDNGERIPGFGWTVAQETVEAMRDIDASIRSAEQMSGTLIFG